MSPKSSIQAINSITKRKLWRKNLLRWYRIGNGKEVIPLILPKKPITWVLDNKCSIELASDEIFQTIVFTSFRIISTKKNLKLLVHKTYDFHNFFFRVSLAIELSSFETKTFMFFLLQSDLLFLINCIHHFLVYWCFLLY